MMTVKQVALLTGVSVRTLQFYDETGLLRPTATTGAGYRLYDGGALETLRQILSYKELDFPLKEIKMMLEDPNFDRTAALARQRELVRRKRDRYDEMLQTLDRLMKGEHTMLDMNEYFRVLEGFRETRADEIIRQLGSLESFDRMISDMRSHEKEIGELARKQYGSVERFAKAMEQSFGEFLSHGPSVSLAQVDGLVDKTDALTRSLTADLTRAPASPAVQEAVAELAAFVDGCNQGTDWNSMAEYYLTHPAFIEATDRKYGAGASRFIGLALRAYCGNV